MIVDCLLMRKVAIGIGGTDALQAMCFSRPSSLRQGLGMCGSLAVSKEVGRHCFSRWLKVSLEISAQVRFGLDFHADQRPFEPRSARVGLRLGSEYASL